MNQKFLRSLSSEWNTHTIVWRNKPKVETMSMDDLYNNLKVYKSKVKGISSSSTNSQNMAFVSFRNSGSTNKAINTSHGVSSPSIQTNTTNLTNVDNLCDDVIYAFLASQPSSPQLVNKDLEQIHPDDLEDIDSKWQMAMLTMRARRFLKNTKKKMNINGTKTIGFDKSKVECYNCHQRRHFARECRAPRNQNNRNRESTTRNVPVETSTLSALVSCDGLENVKNLREQYDQLTKDYRKSQIKIVAYKSGLESVEARLEVFKKNKGIYEDDIKLLKREIQFKEIAITKLRKKLEKALKEKDKIQLTVEKFKNSSKSLNKFLDSQIADKCKIGLGYNTVPPPYKRNFLPPKPNFLFITPIDESADKPITSNPIVETSEAKSSEEKPKEMSANVVRDHDGDDGSDVRLLHIRPSLTCVLTWNPTAGHKSMRASNSTFKRSTMDEMVRLHGLGSNTSMGVPYIEDKIMAIVWGGKQRGHIPGMLTQLESQPEYGSGSRSGGCGDDELGDDENGGEDEEDEDDS
uniref:CCHC-type domain-containing protein n=1 Tax=Tanacetum cinerariifolium TaxID=118510 RepID=A0A6L2LM68_TANCI|nr:hypothetical protein [Tanacetum cinerariifolium]